MIIYKIINKINGKIYIGSTNNFKSRKDSHIRELRKNKHENILLQNAWNKYGEDNFEFIIIKQFKNISRDELYFIEENYVKNNKAYKNENGYNIANPANKPPVHTGKKRTAETRLKMSLSQKGRKQPRYVIEAARLSNIGRKQSKETIFKRIEKLKGRKKPEGMMEKLRIKNTGSKRSEDSKKKMSLARIGKYQGEKNINAILTEKQVIQIKKDLLNNERICDISRKYNIKQVLIKNIKYGNSWRHIKI